MGKVKFFKAIAALSAVLAIFVAFSLILSACGSKKKKEEGPETGEYYCDVNGAEQLIKLYGGYQFDFNVGGEQKTGEYTLSEESLVLEFSGGDKISATYANETISFVYNGSPLTFIRKTPYTVSFSTGEAAAMADVTVINGRTLPKPLSPEVSGKVFAGWYKDAAFSQPYDFSSPVTSSFTLYARFVAFGEQEFTISFDTLGGSAAPDPVRTAGGMVFELPSPTRDGYTFLGWWISMTNRAEELSYRYEDGIVFTENTTLFAQWRQTTASSKLASPAVSVKENMISWDGITGASTYRLVITNSEGELVANENVGGANKEFDFSSRPAGDYRVEVTAVASNTANNSEPCVRYFRNHALSRVSLFSVEGNILTFNKVANATGYFVTVVCGDSSHSHTDVSIGDNNTYDFSGCLMQKGGIIFTVKAAAENFVTSTSAPFAYSLDLSPATGFGVDEAAQILSWTPTEDAQGYFVSVNGGEEERVTSASFSLKEYPQGQYAISVTPYAVGYNSPDASVFNYTKTILATPSGIKLLGYDLSWNSVGGAQSYEIKIGEQVYTTQELSYNLQGKISFDNPLTLRAVGATQSAWSDELSFSDSLSLKYERNTISWQPIPGVTSYKIRINGGAEADITDGSHSMPATLTLPGDNKIEGRFLLDGQWSDWTEITVFAYTLRFNTQGGGGIASHYYAAGDIATVPETNEKTGYTFAGWYDAEENGAHYEDNFVVEGNVELYARYNPNPIEITLVNGSQRWQETVYYEQEYHLTVPVSDEELAFDGWYGRTNGGGTQYTDAYGNSLNIYTVLTSTTMYANWAPLLLEFTLGDIPGESEKMWIVSANNVLNNDSNGQYKRVNIPETYKGYTVGMIAENAFSYCSGIEEIVIPDTIRLISEAAPFYKCEKLQAVTVRHIEGNTRVRYMSDGGVLYDFGNIDDQTANPTPRIMFVPQAKSGFYTVVDGVRSIPMLTFDHSSLTNITLPASVTEVATRAFDSCNNLRVVTILDPSAGAAEGLSIKANAFYFCEGLTTVNLPKRLTDIELGRYTLSGYSGAPAVRQVITSGEGAVSFAFIGCNNVNLKIAEGAENFSIDSNGIIYNANRTKLIYYPQTLNLASFEIPSGVTVIEKGAFLGNKKLTSVKIPNTVTEIGECAFYGCENLRSVTFEGDSLIASSVIGMYAFRDLQALKTVTFEEGCAVSEIGEGAFMGCSALTGLHLRGSLGRIGNCAFMNCSLLSSVEFDNGRADNPIAFGDDLFYNCTQLKSVRIPSNATTLPGLGGMVALESVIIDPQNNNFKSVRDVIYSIDGSVLYFYPRGKEGDFQIPSDVGVIAGGAFENVTGLTSITIGENVTAINSGAFANSGITSLTIEGGSKPLEIAQRAFYGCNITALSLPARVVKIGGYAFAGTSIATLTLNDGLTEVGAYAFANNSHLTDVTISSGVQSIGEGAFSGLGSLAHVTFNNGIALAELPADLFSRSGSAGQGGFAIEIPASVTKIGDGAFESSAVNSVTFQTGSALSEIGNESFFNCSALTSFNVPATVKEIGQSAFAYSALSNLTFEEGDEDLVLAQEAFRTTEIAELQLPARLTELNFNTFHENGNLFSVDFGDDSRLKYIATFAFQSCRELTTVVIPASVGDCTVNGQYHDAVEEGAFRGCIKLSEFICEAGNTHSFTIGSEAFYAGLWSTNTSITRLVLPAGTRYPDGFFGYEVGSQYTARFTNLQEVIINDDPITSARAYASYEGAVYSADYSTLVFCPSQKSGELVLHNSVKNIAANAFKGCALISEISVPASWQSLNANMFNDCTGLTRLKISDPVPGEEVNLAMDGKGAITADGGTKLIYFPKNSEEEAYEVPSTVTEISDSAFEGVKNLKSVTFAQRTADLTISSRAFAGSGLTSFCFPATLVSVAEGAFAGCGGLLSVTAEEGCKLTSLPIRLFDGCAALASVEIPENVEKIPSAVSEQGLFYGCIGLKTITFKGEKLTEVGDYGFYTGMIMESSTSGTNFFYSQIDDIRLPQSLQKIGAYAFYMAVGLKNLTIPAKVTELGEGAFDDSGLQTVTFGSGLTVIPQNAFYNCESLTTVNLPDTLERIEANAFAYTRALRGIEFPATLLQIESGAFMSSGLSTLTLPQNLATLGEGAFQNNSNLTQAHMGGKITRMEGRIFYGDSRLSTVEIGEGITSIPEEMFRGCSSLTGIQLPATIRDIGRYAFTGSGLVTFTLPIDVEYIAAYAFSGCSGLTEVTLHSQLTSIAEGAFEGCYGITRLEVPKSVSQIGQGAFSGWGAGQTVFLQGVASEDSIPASWAGWDDDCGAAVEYASDN